MSTSNDQGPAYVYTVRDAAGRAIYVGATVNLGARLDMHRRNSWWAGQAAKVTAEVAPTMGAARLRERSLIRELNPRWNVQSRWSARSSWSAADYADYYKAIVNNYPSASRVRRAHLATVTRHARALFDIDVAREVEVAS